MKNYYTLLFRSKILFNYTSYHYFNTDIIYIVYYYFFYKIIFYKLLYLKLYLSHIIIFLNIVILNYFYSFNHYKI